MKRKSRFIIVLASATVTFGIFWVTLGTPKYVEHCKQMHSHCCQTEVSKK